MKFNDLPISTAKGWFLAHSLLVKGKRYSKGTCLTDDIILVLEKAGIKTASLYQPEEGDINENAAADYVAQHIAGEGCSIAAPAHGRSNIYAAANGVAFVSDRLNSLNASLHHMGVATVHNQQAVHTEQLIATVKTIPYSFDKKELLTIATLQNLIHVAPFKPFNAALLCTGHPLAEKTTRITAARLQRVMGTLQKTIEVEHIQSAITAHLHTLASRDTDIILIAGVSAISDIRDTVPAALIAAGGKVLQLGMPVDPGNLLLLGELAGKTVVGLPGCARSPALNGLDWVLERFAARLPLDATVIRHMGIGGLLAEAYQRPEPRTSHVKKATKTAALVLAAGKSSRSGDSHKLLANLNGKSVLETTLSHITIPLYVVTGYRANALTALISAHANQIYNDTHANGMGTSIAAGIAALPDDIEQVFICLADMPFIRSNIYSSLISAAATLPEAQIFIPTFNGKRGNPVLWRKSQFAELKALSGDIGGRAIIQQSAALIAEIPVDDPSILIDLDTPEALAQFGIRVTNP